MYLQTSEPQVHYVVSRSHLYHSDRQELDHSSYSIDILVSNADVIGVITHLTATDLTGSHSQEFPDQNHAAVLVYR